MKRLKYILKKLKTFQTKEMFNIINKVNKITKKNKIFIFFDIIYCAFKYGSGYMDYFEFEFYLLNNKERSTYITSHINNNIVKKYNDKESIRLFDDKIKFNNKFSEFLKREYIDLRSCSFDEFESFVKKHKKIVGKVIDSTGGKGVSVIEVKNVKTLYKKLKENKQYLVEEYIVQHKDMNKLYSESVNTLRILSFLDKDEVVILKTILKIGNNGSVDNFSSGGMYTFVDENGVVYVPAVDEKGNVYEKHPITNEKIVGFKVPYYDGVIKLVSKLGKVEKKVKYIGWDIAITKDGPVVVEGNPYSGIFQVKPSISGIKIGDLPNYKKYMDI